MQKIKHTSVRKGTYYIQLALPTGLYRKSLLTDSAKEVTRILDLLTQTISLVKKGELSTQDLTNHIDEITGVAVNKPVTVSAGEYNLTESEDDNISSLDDVPEFDFFNVGTGAYLSLLDAWKLYKAEKGTTWTRAISQANERYFEILLKVLGEDRNVSTICKADIRNVMSVVNCLPKRVVQPYRSMTVQQLIECEDIAEDDYIGTEAVHKHLKLYKSVFKTFLTDSKDFLQKAPTDGVTAPQSKTRFGAYTEDEVMQFVSYAVKREKREWLKWIILLLAYTGARRSEIAKLTKQDIKIDPLTQRHYILITDGKTENATREIVIHPHLIEWGFLDYVAKMHVLLFPVVAGKNMAKIGKVIGDIRDFLKIPYTDNSGKRRLVHSFRHSVVTAATEWMRDLTHVQAVVGHKLTKTGITGRYIHNLPIRITAYIIDGLNWKYE